MHQLQGTQIGTLRHSCSITAGHSAMASSRQQPSDMTFQIRAIPTSLTDNLQEWGPNKQLAEMIDTIGAQDHIADLREKVHNLSLTAVHQQDLRQSTSTAILAGVLPGLILAILAAGAVSAWRFCGPLIANRARAWAKARRDRQQPYNLYICLLYTSPSPRD